MHRYKMLTFIARPSARPRCVTRDGRKGTYRGQRRGARGVPRADVRVERRCTLERLRAEHIRSAAMNRFHPFIADTGASVCTRVLLSMRLAEHTHIHARAHGRGCVSLHCARTHPRHKHMHKTTSTYIDRELGIQRDIATFLISTCVHNHL